MANGQITVTFRKDKKVVKELSRDMHPDELVQFEGLIFDPEFPKATISSTLNVGNMDFGKGVSVQMFTSVGVSQTDDFIREGHRKLVHFHKNMYLELLPEIMELQSELFRGK